MTNETTITPGAVVRSASGGLKMTVDRIAADGETVSCVWFDEEGAVHRERFTASSLRVVTKI